MRLVNLDEILLRLDLVKDDPKYSKNQRDAIVDCIHAVKEVPEQVNYKYLGAEVTNFLKSYRP